MVEKGRDTAGDSDASPRAPTQIGKYELRGEIGRGACGVVFHGFDPFVQRDVAVKVALHDPEAIHDSAHERSFFAEARAADEGKEGLSAFLNKTEPKWRKK